jgi:hypothetical protein
MIEMKGDQVPEEEVIEAMRLAHTYLHSNVLKFNNTLQFRSCIRSVIGRRASVPQALHLIV